ncbi:MAG: helicase-related protein [Kiritimatiellae bacterium]|nr:helicase-related protein [Kiritimatiellia bacterium]
MLERLDLWDAPAFRVWLPNRDAIVVVPMSDLSTASGDGDHGSNAVHEARLRYVLMAARLANLLTEDVLLAPIDASVIPLPHQLKALRKAVSRDRVRFLLADEVGLGKTIEAGLIVRELKLRGLVNRVLVISPRGLITQWLAEMKTHFGEEFRFFFPADFPSYRRLAHSDNIWQTYNQVICSLDSVKPLEARKGWSAEQLAQFNQDRFLDLISAGWDLIIVDEAHRLGGSTAQVARHQLGKGLAEAAPYLLLLSATPHQGKSEAFHRLLTLLDSTAFPDPSSVTKERVMPHVIRTEKRHAIDAAGKPLFQPRLTKLVVIPWRPEHATQKLLYEAVTEYVREGYNQAMQEKKAYLGFLLILMQRLVTSSTRAISTTLTRRLEVLTSPQSKITNPKSETALDDDLLDDDPENQLSVVISAPPLQDPQSPQIQNHQSAIQNPLEIESAEVRRLLALAHQVEAQGPDARAEALLEWIYTLQKEESDPDLKFLLFTEFLPTQEMLADFLTSRGFSVVCLNGSMDMEQRAQVQKQFAGATRILISTDAGGEGLNLQFCHIVVNYDLPWNPMRLEQRIGRVDRIGQPKVVRALNLVLEETIECRVREVLEEKLSLILQEFGVDKTGDVLDSLDAGNIFDNLFVEALLHPDRLPDEVRRTITAVQDEAARARTQRSLFDDPVALEPSDAQKAQNLPLGEWLETMTENYLLANGGAFHRREHALEVRWPNETALRQIAFPSKNALLPAGIELLSLEHPRIRGLLTRMPRYAPGQTVRRVRLDGLPDTIRGFWSLWQIGMLTSDRRRQKVLPVFVHDDGRVLQPTARFIWEEMNSKPWRMHGALTDAEAERAYTQCERAAREQGREVFMQLRQRHVNQLQLEQEKTDYSFRARRKLLGEIGLPEVRAHRLRQLLAEEDTWRHTLEQQKQALPDLVPLAILRIS